MHLYMFSTVKYEADSLDQHKTTLCYVNQEQKSADTFWIDDMTFYRLTQSGQLERRLEKDQATMYDIENMIEICICYLQYCYIFPSCL